jgi:hypothetical protein
LKHLYSGTHRGVFKSLLILDLWGKSFHAVIVFGLGKDLLFKTYLGHCERIERKQEKERQMNDCGYVNDLYYSPVAAKIPICQL